MYKINDNIDIANIVCNWYTYNGSQCRRNICFDKKNNCNFCSMHKQLFEVFSLPNSEMCEISKDINIIPRSYKHIKTVMKELNYEDNIVDVVVKGGITEEADLSDNNYITLLSDDSKYYYPLADNTYPKNCNKVKNLKVILKKYCENKSIIRYNDNNYCEECYKKIKNVPKLSISLRFLHS